MGYLSSHGVYPLWLEALTLLGVMALFFGLVKALGPERPRMVSGIGLGLGMVLYGLVELVFWSDYAAIVPLNIPCSSTTGSSRVRSARW